MKLSVDNDFPLYAQGENLRKYLPKKLWDEIRSYQFKLIGNKCSICGYEGNLEGHEVWDFDELNYVLILKDVVPLCNLCHSVKHFNGTFRRLHNDTLFNGKNKKETEEKADIIVDHFMKVNNCNIEDMKKHLTKVYTENKRDIKKEKMLKEQDWKFSIPKTLPYIDKVESILKMKDKLYEVLD